MRAAPHLMSIKAPFWGIPLRKCGKGSQDTRQGCATARTPRSPVYSINQDIILCWIYQKGHAMLPQIRVAILDDHQSIIDGFTYRLSMDPRIQIVGTAIYGEALEPMIADKEVDVLLLDVSVPNSPEDHNPYPVLHFIPHLLEKYINLNILIISMFTQHSLIDALVNTGISGYIFKDDQVSIQKLDKVVEIIANGGIYFSQGAYREPQEAQADSLLTPRQLEALSLCASFPDGDTIALAGNLGITGSTLRNLLSGAYLRLGVRTRAAAIARAQQLGILPNTPELPLPDRNAPAKPFAKSKQRVRRRILD
jgi:two-component system response regulator NreC